MLLFAVAAQFYRDPSHTLVGHERTASDPQLAAHAVSCLALGFLIVGG